MEHSTTLCLSNLEHWMTEQFIQSLFYGIGSKVEVTVPRDARSGNMLGYALLRFLNRELAERVLTAYRGLPIPNTKISFNLSWNTGETPLPGACELTVGNLPPNMTNMELFQLFSTAIPGVISTAIQTERGTTHSRGIGTVRFATQRDCQRALIEMNSVQVEQYPLTLQMSSGRGATEDRIEVISEDYVDSTGESIFVQNTGDVHELRKYFEQFGEIVSIRLLENNDCCFIKFEQKSFANKAMLFLNETKVSNSPAPYVWTKVGPTFDLSTQIAMQRKPQEKARNEEAILTVRKQRAMQLNREYVTIHGNPLLHSSEFLPY